MKLGAVRRAHINSTLITALQQFEQDLRRLGGDQAPQRKAAKAYAASGPSSSGRTPQNKGRQSNSGSSVTSKRKSKMECYYCHKLGHLASECRKKMQDERKGGDTPASSSNSNPAAAYTALSSEASYGADEWLLDSGATEHMTGNRALLSDFTVEIPPTLG